MCRKTAYFLETNPSDFTTIKSAPFVSTWGKNWRRGCGSADANGYKDGLARSRNTDLTAVGVL